MIDNNKGTFGYQPTKMKNSKSETTSQKHQEKCEQQSNETASNGTGSVPPTGTAAITPSKNS